MRNFLFRLAQGHARLLAHNSVEIVDALFAVILLETSAESSSSLLGASNPLHATFPKDPEAEYRQNAERILCSLDLNHLWRKESTRLNEDERKRLEENFSQESEGVNTQKPEDVMLNEAMNDVMTKLRNNQYSFGALTDCVVQKTKSKKRKGEKSREKGKKKRRRVIEDDDFQPSKVIHAISDSDSDEKDLQLERRSSEINVSTSEIVTSTQVTSGEKSKSASGNSLVTSDKEENDVMSGKEKIKRSGEVSNAAKKSDGEKQSETLITSEEKLGELITSDEKISKLITNGEKNMEEKDKEFSKPLNRKVSLTSDEDEEIRKRREKIGQKTLDLIWSFAPNSAKTPNLQENSYDETLKEKENTEKSVEGASQKKSSKGLGKAMSIFETPVFDDDFCDFDGPLISQESSVNKDKKSPLKNVSIHTERSPLKDSQIKKTNICYKKSIFEDDEFDF